MVKPIRTLLIDDSETDGALIERELKRGGIDPDFRRVATPAALSTALEADNWDIVLCDYIMPGFDTKRALEIVREHDSDLPFIVISGVVRTSDVVDVLRSGAQDFIEKDDLARLVPAVERAVREAGERRALHKTEEALNRSEARFHDLIVGSDLGIQIASKDGDRLFVNQALADLFGYESPEEIMALPGAALVAEYHRERLDDFRRRTFENPEAGASYEFDGLRKDGTMIPLQALVRLIDWEGQTAIQRTFLDLTARKTAEEQLRQAQKMEAVGQLTGGIAHDFNNLLTVLMGSLEILKPKTEIDPTAGKHIDSALSAVKRGADLTRRLLAVSRRQPLSPSTVLVNGLIDGMSELLRRTLGEQVEIETRFAADPWPAEVDTAQLENALLNLTINARDAMPEGGKLTIETANQTLDEGYARTNPEVMPGDYVVISVSDTGTGMPADILDRVFEPFFTTKSVGHGSGLGLSMVFGFVKQSGGHVTAYSEPGEGTTIRIYLPKSNKTSEAVPRNRDTGEVTRGVEKVLVVEDDPDVRSYVVATLDSLGYDVSDASDGPNALALLESGLKADLLFTDVVLPGGMNGREVAELAAMRCPGIKILYTSGYAESAIVHQGRLDENVALLTKPYASSDLGRKVRSVLDSVSG